jgi:hypothetical protein
MLRFFQIGIGIIHADAFIAPISAFSFGETHGETSLAKTGGNGTHSQILVRSFEFSLLLFEHANISGSFSRQPSNIVPVRAELLAPVA